MQQLIACLILGAIVAWGIWAEKQDKRPRK